jgi:hypothetical protein
MIKERDEVVPTEALPEEKLEAGDVGWVVLVHRDGAGFEVEFVTLAGETVSAATSSARKVRPVALQEIAHVRRAA